MKKRIAALIRVLTIPPIMVLLLLITMYSHLKESFVSPNELLILILLLGILPVLAYPLQQMIPKWKEAGRDVQRRLAFLFTLLGYTSAFLWALITGRNPVICTVTASYFGGVLLLTALNKLVHFKASGHACSFTSSLLLLSYFVDRRFIFPGIIVSAAVCWASLYLKRHTFSQLAGGILTAITAFVLAAQFLMH